MARAITTSPTLTVRPLQYRDLDELKQWCIEDLNTGSNQAASPEIVTWLDYQYRWYAFLKVRKWFPRPLPQGPLVFVAECQNLVVGFIQVAPFNRTRSTWQVEQIVVNQTMASKVLSNSFIDVGSKLLRYCFEAVWEARNWILEVNVQDKSALGLYRFNGFQPLAQATYWSLSADQIANLAERDPDLPNLLPISNADAQLLYQLNTAAMPPQVRQVFDQQIQDFQVNLVGTFSATLDRLIHRLETVSTYVFEQQRKAAIGQFKLTIARDGRQPHRVELTVHPAYTWLYPELIVQMAKILQPFPSQALHLVSFDYQPEREECLTQMQATPGYHTLLMSRSVWHKVRERKSLSLEGLQLSDVLPGLQPVGKPAPGRMGWLPREGENFPAAKGQR